VNGEHHVLEAVVARCPRQILEADLELLTASRDAGQDLTDVPRIEICVAVCAVGARRRSCRSTSSP